MPDSGRRRFFRLEGGARHATKDVEAEIEFHLAMRARTLADTGLPPTEARARALERFGDVGAVRAECITIDTERARAMRLANLVSQVRLDVTYAVRGLVKRPGFLVVVLLMLALGIGANTATFTLVDALLLRALPVPHPEQLVTIGNTRRTSSLSQGTPQADLASYPLYVDLRDQNRALSGLYASGRSDRLDVFVGRGREPEHPHGRFVSANYFSVLRVPAAAGRVFAPDEDRVPGAAPVIVISDRYWRQRFGGDRAAIGHVLAIDGTPMTVIGVAPPGFSGDIVGQPIDIWIPLTMQPTLMPHTTWLTDRGVSWLLLMGRLAPGITVPRARAELTALEQRSLTEHAAAGERGGIERNLQNRPPKLEPGATGFSGYRGVYTSSLLTVMAAVGLILLITCANVASMMLARASARGREMSVRIALGAGRRRLVQQLLTESLLLAIAGGALGLLIALWGSSVILHVAGGRSNPIPMDARVDGRVLAFTGGLSLLTAVLCGLVPALRATRGSVAGALRTQSIGAGTPDRIGRLSLGKLLVVTQVALSMLLLVGTGVLVQSMWRLQHADVGLQRDQLVIATINTQRAGYTGPRLTVSMRDLLARVGQIPGVTGVSLSENGIFSGTESGTTLQVEGFTARADSDTLVSEDEVGPGYFHVIGAHVLAGRDIEARDNETAPKVVVFNETMSRFYFPRGDAIGHHITFDSAACEIVGVVGDVQENSVRGPPIRRIYVPTAQRKEPPGEFTMEIRTTGNPANLVTPVRRTLVAADASLDVLTVDPLTDLIGDSMNQDRMVAQVMTFFGVLALILAAIGLYGVMAYATVRRTSEFGLRMALGALPSDVSRMVLREALTLALVGIAIGLPIALVATRLLRGQLFGVGPFDPTTIGLAIAALAGSAAVAGYLPASRASSVAPLEAIRTP